MYAIETENLTKKFKSLTAVDSLNFNVGKGEIFCLVGPDGAGKSTTIKMLTTVYDVTEGDGHIFGKSVITQPEEVKKHIGYMSEEFSLYRDLSVLENLTFFADLYGVTGSEKEEKTKMLLDFARLKDFKDFRSQNLSGGMKQKLALACCLIRDPDVLFLDEPTTGVDPVSRRDFWRILSKLHARGVTLFITTPYMDEAERATRVAFMREGKIILLDTPQNIKDKVKGVLYQIKVTRPMEASRFLKRNGLKADNYGELLEVILPSENEFKGVELLLKQGNFELASSRKASMSMENAFVSILQGYE